MSYADVSSRSKINVDQLVYIFNTLQSTVVYVYYHTTRYGRYTKRACIQRTRHIHIYI